MNEQEIRLRAEILADAAAAAEKVLSDAAEEAKKIVSAAKSAVEAEYAKAVTDAKASAEAKAKRYAAGVDMEIGRRWLKRQEEGIDRVLCGALSSAEGTSGDERAASLSRLAQEAMSAIGDDTFTVRVGSSDAQIVTVSWLDAQAAAVFGAGRQGGASTVVVEDGIGGGLVVSSADGRKTFDNTYATRLSRMRDQLRLMVVND